MRSIRLDSVGAESGGGGLATTLRDLARFGEAMRCDGAFNGQQIVPAAVVADIRRGADPAHFANAGYTTLPGWSYRNMWWVARRASVLYCARHSRAIDLGRSDGRDGDCALRIASDGGQCLP